MTHNELLDKIYWHWKNSNDAEFHGLSGYRRALREVVKLHKPKYWQGIEMVCEGCGMNIEQNYNSEYPCETIQAIERELSNG